MKTLFAIFYVVGFAVFGSLSASAQTDPPTQFWEADIPGGNYMVKIDTISTISTHQYLVQAGVRVWEVNIGDTSSTVARFYYMEPVKPDDKVAPLASAITKTQDLAQQVAAAGGAEQIFLKVVKDYPTSTHAHTVEFRLDKLSNLESLYQHLKNAYKQKLGGTFRIAGGDR